MNSLGIGALDLGLRGAAAGLFLMMVAVILLRIRPLTTVKLLGAAMSAAGAAYAIATAPLASKTILVWALPIVAANPVIFWLWAHAAFDDDFVIRRWHGVLWLVVVGIGFASLLSWPTSPALGKAGFRLLAIMALVLTLAAAVQTVKTWSADLVAGRRRLRFAILIVSLLFIGLIVGSDLTSISFAKVGISGSLVSALGLLTLAALAVCSMFQPQWSGFVFAATAARTAGGRAAQAGPADDSGRDAIAPALLSRLDQLMTVERIYRHEGVTIGTLAAKVDLPEHRLRQVINEALGYRNFNAFLNHYRLVEAKAGLSDPEQREVPVLTIAMDAGFQSIGPFNRAFKADTGVTPTEFRRDATARSQAGMTESIDKPEGGHSAREIG